MQSSDVENVELSQKESVNKSKKRNDGLWKISNIIAILLLLIACAVLGYFAWKFSNEANVCKNSASQKIKQKEYFAAAIVRCIDEATQGTKKPQMGVQCVSNATFQFCQERNKNEDKEKTLLRGKKKMTETEKELDKKYLEIDKNKEKIYSEQLEKSSKGEIHAHESTSEIVYEAVYDNHNTESYRDHERNGFEYNYQGNRANGGDFGNGMDYGENDDSTNIMQYGNRGGYVNEMGNGNNPGGFMNENIPSDGDFNGYGYLFRMYEYKVGYGDEKEERIANLEEYAWEYTYEDYDNTEHLGYQKNYNQPEWANYA